MPSIGSTIHSHSLASCFSSGGSSSPSNTCPGHVSAMIFAMRFWLALSTSVTRSFPVLSPLLEISRIPPNRLLAKLPASVAARTMHCSTRLISESEIVLDLIEADDLVNLC